jgi:hypothetical protein
MPGDILCFWNWKPFVKTMRQGRPGQTKRSEKNHAFTAAYTYRRTLPRFAFVYNYCRHLTFGTMTPRLDHSIGAMALQRKGNSFELPESTALAYCILWRVKSNPTVSTSYQSNEQWRPCRNTSSDFGEYVILPLYRTKQFLHYRSNLSSPNLVCSAQSIAFRGSKIKPGWTFQSKLPAPTGLVGSRKSM